MFQPKLKFIFMTLSNKWYEILYQAFYYCINILHKYVYTCVNTICLFAYSSIKWSVYFFDVQTQLDKYK